MPYNKLIIRRLPPSMNEDEFLKQVGPLADHDYFCFFDATPGLGKHSFSRAYINFVNLDDKQTFIQRFDNHIFLDKHGREYPAVVEESFWHKSATSGPFYTKRCHPSDGASEVPTDGPSKDGQEAATIEQDHDFLEFVDRLQNQQRKTQQSPIQTIENNLDELTNASTSNSTSGKQKKISTPLLEYVNQVRMMKNSKKSK